LNYSVDNLDQAKAGLSRLYTALRNVKVLEAERNSEYEVRFRQAMDDDFNTPLAYAVLFDIAKEINTLKSSDAEKAGKLAGLLKELGDVLGLLSMDPEEFLKGAVDKSDVDVSVIEAIIKERNDARREKNWAVADAARKKLSDMGIVIEDGPNGTTWRKN
jgi:cysteinyl-tRNA synthetase